MKITIIGHSTVLVETGGQRILTDPYFGTGGNPAYMRKVPPARTRDDLRDVNLVLISHNHWDHTDRRYLRSLGQDVPVLAPARSRWMTKLHGAHRPTGMKPWQEKQFGPIKITAVPAMHMIPAIGYIIQGEHKSVYFAGDTYHRPFMKEIGNRFHPDIALMPVTTFRLPMTMGEKSAVAAAKDLGAQVIIPIHLALTPRSPLLRTNHSVDGFAKRVSEAGLAAKVIFLKEGESWETK